jgi:hypothetical protein
VVGHQTTTGTNQGEFMGAPATGKSIEVSEIHIVRIVNGKAVEHWGLMEDMAMMQQLGLMVAPGGRIARTESDLSERLSPIPRGLGE